MLQQNIFLVTGFWGMSYEEKVCYLGCVIKKQLLLNSVWLVLTPRIYQSISFVKKFSQYSFSYQRPFLIRIFPYNCIGDMIFPMLKLPCQGIYFINSFIFSKERLDLSNLTGQIFLDRLCTEATCKQAYRII